MESVVRCLLLPLLGFVFEVSLLLDEVYLFHHHFGLAGGDAMDAIQFVHDFSDRDKLRGEVFVAIEGQGGIAEGLQLLGVEDGFRILVGDDVGEKSVRMYFVVVVLGVLEIDDDVFGDIYYDGFAEGEDDNFLGVEELCCDGVVHLLLGQRKSIRSWAECDCFWVCGLGVTHGGAHVVRRSIHEHIEVAMRSASDR